MKFIDTHAHVYLPELIKEIDLVLERSLEADVGLIHMPNIDDTSIDDMLSLEEKYRGICVPMIGLHPCSINKKFQRQLYKVEKWINERDFCAIGEVGTDLYWDKTFYSEQQEALRIQLIWAAEKKWPAVIHCRNSMDETIKIIKSIKEMGFPELRGVFHCFSGNLSQAKEIIDLGFYLGIGGISTFKNGGLDKVLPDIGLEHLVLETDSPYLAPTPYRGKRNEPSYIPLIAARVAELKGTKVESVAKSTSDNAINLFNSKDQDHELSPD